MLEIFFVNFSGRKIDGMLENQGLRMLPLKDGGQFLLQVHLALQVQILKGQGQSPLHQQVSTSMDRIRKVKGIIMLDSQ